MIKQKGYSIIIFLIISFFTLKTYSQIKKSNNESWITFKNSAHKIGFCVYHVQQEVCKEHSQIKYELQKISNSESEVHYFELNSKWAKDRLTSLAENTASKSEYYLILFDIDQGSFKKLYDSTKTSNSHRKFSVFNLKDKFEFKMRRETSSRVDFYILSNRASSILSNTMWREFFSNRLGRLDSKIEISVSGSNALKDYYNFKDSFMNFVKK